MHENSLATLRHEPAFLSACDATLPSQEAYLRHAPPRTSPPRQPAVRAPATAEAEQSQAAVAGVPGAPLELSCQVLIDGESKTVSFPMDFATDTPESVAREMVEELGIPENEATIRDIVAQIKSVRPAADGAAGVTHLEPTREEAVGGTQSHHT